MATNEEFKASKKSDLIITRLALAEIKEKGTTTILEEFIKKLEEEASRP